MLTARRRTAMGVESVDVRIPNDVALGTVVEMIGRSLGWQGVALDSIEQCGTRFLPDLEINAVQAAICDGAYINLGASPKREAGGVGVVPTLGGPPVAIAQHELLGAELEIAAPAAAPARPRVAWPSMILPTLFGIGSLAATTATRANGNLPMNVMTTGYMLLSAATMLLNYARERRAWSQAMQKRGGDYAAYLAFQRERLRAAAAQQLVLALEADPDPERAAQRIIHHRRIWTGGALAARVGTGAAPLNVCVKPPRSEPLLQPDPLCDAALALCNELCDVDGMPVHLDLSGAPAIGLAGPRAFLLGAARALVLNLTSRHSPERLRVAAIFPPDEQDDWAWLRWLPHIWFEGGAERALACESEGATRVFERIAASLDDRSGRGVHTLVLLADERHAADPRIAAFVSASTSVRSFMHFAKGREALPRRCATFVEYEGGKARLHQSGRPPQTIDAPDFATVAACDASARALAALPEERWASQLAIPSMTPLLDLWNVRDAQHIDVAANWRSCTHLDDESLRVPIGRGAGGALVELDLRDGDRGHGAHGLVAGTTGSGKSELLQTLVASLAVRFHPDWLAFLLIDYKGGGMAGAFRGDDGDLPHLAGVMTNLVDAGAARRALIALDSELKQRQRVFQQHDVTYIDAYQRKYAADLSGALAPMPRLVIIVDEFAELKRDQPEFMKQLVSAARIGRSLGVHLILATQKPSGVVDEQIWSNSRFKLCLRVQDEGDSKEMLKRSDAARLRQAGRAIFMVGSGERFEEFQSAYGGAAYRPECDPVAAARFVAPLLLDGRCDMTRAAHAEAIVEPPLDAPTQLQALVSHLTAVGTAVRSAERIWLDPLPDSLSWDDARLMDHAPADEGLRAVIGLLDDPRTRRQPPLVIDLHRDGHLLVYGQSGAGKSMLLQRLVLSLARGNTPAALVVTVLDCGSRSLRPLEALPHVADVLTDDDDERVARLFRRLKREMAQRRMFLDGRKLAELRRSDPKSAPPAWLLVIDNYPAFARLEHDDALAAIVRDGPALGIHVVLTANKPLDVRSRISGNIAAVLCLQQADRGDYGAAVGRTNGLEPVGVPGRGLVRTPAGPLEFQTALPSAGADAAACAAVLLTEGDVMRIASESAPGYRVPTMPEALLLRDLPAPLIRQEQLTRQAIGLQTLDLEPLLLPLDAAQHLVITGTPGSGKTTLLCTIAHALGRTRAEIVYVEADGSESALPPEVVTCKDEAQFAAVVDGIESKLLQWRQQWQHARSTACELMQAAFAATLTPQVVLIDDADAFTRGLTRATRDRLDVLLERGVRGWPVHFVLAGSDRGMDPVDGWIKRVKDAGGWFVLGGLQSVGFALKLPASERDRALPPGHGYLVTRRSPRPVRFRAAEP